MTEDAKAFLQAEIQSEETISSKVKEIRQEDQTNAKAHVKNLKQIRVLQYRIATCKNMIDDMDYTDMAEAEKIHNAEFLHIMIQKTRLLVYLLQNTEKLNCFTLQAHISAVSCLVNARAARLRQGLEKFKAV
jgi:hypothetical protein